MANIVSNPDISVIVPVWNSATTLPACIEALTEQTLPNQQYEIILVDDCSTDGTSELCDAYAKDYENVLTFHQTSNSGGASLPRNVGLKAARGEYILFVDADDWIGAEALERWLNHAREWNSDYVLGRSINANLTEQSELVTVMKSDIASYTDLNMYDNFEICQTWASWGRLVKRAVLIDNCISFDEDINYFEDFVWNLRVLQIVRNASIANDYEYYYLRRDQGAVSLVQSVGVVDCKRPEALANTVHRMFSVLEEDSANLNPNHAFWRKLFQHPIRDCFDLIDAMCKMVPEEYPDKGRGYKEYIWDRVRPYYSPEVRMSIPLNVACRFDSFEAGLGFEREDPIIYCEAIKRTNKQALESIKCIGYDGFNRLHELDYLSDQSFMRLLAAQVASMQWFVSNVSSNPVDSTLNVSGFYRYGLIVTDSFTISPRIKGDDCGRIINMTTKQLPWGEKYQERGMWSFTIEGASETDNDIVKSLEFEVIFKDKHIATLNAGLWDNELGRPYKVDRIKEKNALLKQKNAELKEQKEQLRKTKKMLHEANQTIDKMKASRSWRMTKGIRVLFGHDGLD